MKLLSLAILMFAFFITPLFSQSVEKPFQNPGVLAKRGEKWIGSDYLGFLTNHIGIDVEFVQSHLQGDPLSVDTTNLENRVAEIFRRQGLVPSVRAPISKPPLPFLHILVMAYAIPRNAYLIFCSARLFEEVEVVREKFIPAGVWQAITWETQLLIVAQKDKVHSQIEELVDEVATTFVNRFRAYNPANPNFPGQQPHFRPHQKRTFPQGSSRPPPSLPRSGGGGGRGY